jgi:hypothetical protein
MMLGDTGKEPEMVTERRALGLVLVVLVVGIFGAGADDAGQAETRSVDRLLDAGKVVGKGSPLAVWYGLEKIGDRERIGVAQVWTKAGREMLQVDPVMRRLHEYGALSQRYKSVFVDGKEFQSTQVDLDARIRGYLSEKATRIRSVEVRSLRWKVGGRVTAVIATAVYLAQPWSWSCAREQTSEPDAVFISSSEPKESLSLLSTSRPGDEPGSRPERGTESSAE